MLLTQPCDGCQKFCSQADGTPAARAAVRPVEGAATVGRTKRFELLGTDRSSGTMGAAVANVRRALDALRPSPRLTAAARIRACVPASAVARGDPEALRRVFGVVAAALHVPRNKRCLTEEEKHPHPVDAWAKLDPPRPPLRILSEVSTRCMVITVASAATLRLSA